MKTMKKAFTAIELTFVIVIIGILAAIAVPKLMATRDDAVYAKVITDIEIMVNDIATFYMSQGKEGFPRASKNGVGWTRPVDMTAVTNVSLYGDASKSPWFDYKIGGKTCFKVGLNVYNYSEIGSSWYGVDRDMAVLKFKKETKDISAICSKIQSSSVFKKFDNDIVRFHNVRFTDKNGKPNGNLGKINGGLVLGLDRGLFDSETESYWSEEEAKKYYKDMTGLDYDDGGNIIN